MVLALLTPASAQGQIAVDLPAGPLGIAVERLAERAALNIVLDDPAMWARHVPAVSGRMTAHDAVRLLARRGGAEAVRVGPAAWRLVSHRTRPRRGTPVAPQPSGEDHPRDIVIVASKRAVPARWIAGSVERLVPVPQIDGGTATLVARSTVISSTYRGAGREKLFVRGIADSSFSGQLQSVTGLYLGNVRLTYSSTDPDLQLYDVARVEVLQGPQGTLYGSGSLAGIIRIEPVPPDVGATRALVGVGASILAHGSSGGDADVVLNLPLSGSVATRLVGYVRDEAGFIDKPGMGRDVNRTRIGGGRAMTRWWPVPGWTIDATAMGQAIRAHDSQYVSAEAPLLTSLNPVAEPFASDYAAGHLTVNGRLGHVVFVSATGVASQALKERFNAIEQINVQTVVDVERRDRLFTHETRVSYTGAAGAGWLAGFAFYRNVERLVQKYGALGADAARYGVSEAALFGESSVQVGPSLVLGMGTRLAQVRSEARKIAASPPDPAAGRTERWFLPTASATLRASDALSIFARYQEGRRPSAILAGLSIVTQPVAGDRLGMIEAGMRWRREGGVQASLSLTHARWRDIQVDYFIDASRFFSGILGDGTIRSVNATLDWPVALDLRIDAALALNDSRVKEPRLAFEDPTIDGAAFQAPPKNLQTATKATIPNIADVIARAGVRWSRPIGFAATLRVDGWSRYEGRSVAAIGPSVVGRQGGYVSTGLALALRRGAAEATLTFDNLLNARGTRFLTGSVVFAGPARPTPVRPFTMRLGLQRKF